MRRALLITARATAFVVAVVALFRRKLIASSAADTRRERKSRAVAQLLIIARMRRSEVSGLTGCCRDIDNAKSVSVRLLYVY